MPTYEYICEECGNEFEEFQRITADPIAVCPACGGHVHRKISAGGGLVFKGNGFYITDYKNKKKPSSKAKEKSPAVEKKAG